MVASVSLRPGQLAEQRRAFSLLLVPLLLFAMCCAGSAGLGGVTLVAGRRVKKAVGEASRASGAGVQVTKGCDISGKHALSALVGVCVASLVTAFVSRFVRGPARAMGMPSPLHDSMDRAGYWNRKDAVGKVAAEALEIERSVNLGILRLLTDRPWTRTPVRPRTLPAPQPNDTWLYGRVFPLGETRVDNIFAMVVAFWAFMWRKTRPSSIAACGWSVLQALAPVANTHVFGMIVNEMKGGTSRMLSAYCCLMMVLNLFESWAAYKFEMAVPLGGMRREFASHLQMHFLGMDEGTARYWPAGRCSAMIEYDVPQAVNLIWGAFFSIARNATSFVALFGLMCWTHGEARLALFVSVATFIVLSAHISLNLASRRHNCLDLAKRKRDWYLMRMAVSTRQLREHRQDHQAREVGILTMEYQEVNTVHASRSAHYFFAKLAATIASNEIGFLAQSVIVFFAGSLVIKGEIDIGTGTVLITAVGLMVSELRSCTNTALQIQEGYVSLLDIVQVLNTKVT